MCVPVFFFPLLLWWGRVSASACWTPHLKASPQSHKFRLDGNWCCDFTKQCLQCVCVCVVCVCARARASARVKQHPASKPSGYQHQASRICCFLLKNSGFWGLDKGWEQSSTQGKKDNDMCAGRGVWYPDCSQLVGSKVEPKKMKRWSLVFKSLQQFWVSYLSKANQRV